VSERRKVLEDNLVLDNHVNLLKFELENLKKDNEKNNELKMNNLNNFNEKVLQDKISNNSLINNLKIRIEELEDLLAQQSSVMDPFKIAELEILIEEDNKEIAKKNQHIEILRSKIKEILAKPNYIFDEKQAVLSLSQAMREKDVLILDLKKALRDLKENIFNNKSEKEPTYLINHRKINEGKLKYFILQLK